MTMPPPGASLRRISDRVFRTSRHFRLLSPRELSGWLRATLPPDACGVLVPCTTAAVGTKAICHRTALALRALERPGRLPAVLARASNDSGNLLAARLVLDGVLEIETDRGFVSGAPAFPEVLEGPPRLRARSRTGALSIEAVQYGQRLHLTDIAALSARLYQYHTLPASPRRLRWEPLLAKALGALCGRPAPRGSKDWVAPDPRGRPVPWLVWSRATRPRRSEPRAPGYKLYLSPSCDDLLEILPLATAILFRSPAIAVKLGGSLSGALRPDKLVAYFARLGDLGDTARTIEAALAGVRAHGVPFTASLTSDGLLSWGSDPPPLPQARTWEQRESWRLWVTNRLAASLVAAGGAPPDAIEPWQFAIQRLRLDGVDCETFTPAGFPARLRPP